MAQNWITRIFSKSSSVDSEDNRKTSNSSSSGSRKNDSSKSTWTSHVRNTKTPRIQPDTIEKATIDYILNKYKKEAFASMAEHLSKSGIPGVNNDRIKEIIHFMGAVLQVVEDDFFVGYRLLKKRMIKIDNYLFSQYRKDMKLRPNIYKLLIFAQNKRFSSNLRENLTAYFAVIEEMNFEIIQFLEDYYKILEDLEKNPKSTVYLRKDYGIKKTYTSEIEDFATQSAQTIQFFTQQQDFTHIAGENAKSTPPPAASNPSVSSFENAKPQETLTENAKSSQTHKAIEHTHKIYSPLSHKLESPREKDMFDLDDDEKII